MKAASHIQLSALSPIEAIVHQHAAEAAFIRHLRTGLVRGSQASLRDLRRLDDRLAAHLDGLRIAGPSGVEMSQAALVEPDTGEVFVAGLLAIEFRNEPAFDRALALAGSLPQAGRGLFSALGWASASALRGVMPPLLGSAHPQRRAVGLVACRLHRVDPGAALILLLRDPSPDVRATALRAAGELGRMELAATCTAAIADADCRFWAAWSAVLLGNRTSAIDALISISEAPRPDRAAAFRLALQSMTVAAAHELLQRVARGGPPGARWLVQGSGITGDPVYVPWLIDHMSRDSMARLAGESFSMITGADLALMDLERKPPEHFEGGPNDDPDDPNVDMDPDDGLPWPDRERVQRWWDANKSRFRSGGRYFMGAPVTREHCIDVLKNGYQRQRILAAHYLCLLNPGTPLFNTSAPAWRQQQLLAEMK